MMNNYLILIIVIFLIFILFNDAGFMPKNKHHKPVTQSQIQPMYFNIDMNKICDKLGDNDKDDKQGDAKNDKKYEKLNSCEKQAVKTCPPEKPLETQLFEQKELVRKLKLQLDDKTPTYRYSKSDRYFMDNELNQGGNVTGDDKFVVQMQAMMRRPKESLDARSMWSKNSLIPFLEQELQMHEGAYGWWEDQDLDAIM